MSLGQFWKFRELHVVEYPPKHIFFVVRNQRFWKFCITYFICWQWHNQSVFNTFRSHSWRVRIDFDGRYQKAMQSGEHSRNDVQRNTCKNSEFFSQKMFIRLFKLRSLKSSQNGCKGFASATTLCFFWLKDTTYKVRVRFWQVVEIYNNVFSNCESNTRRPERSCNISARRQKTTDEWY